jgi:hypothetical protein
MKRGRLPLTALRSFEVAGRHQSFTRAAEELFISQAAISRQIRELEALPLLHEEDTTLWKGWFAKAGCPMPRWSKAPSMATA